MRYLLLLIFSLDAVASSGEFPFKAIAFQALNFFGFAFLFFFLIRKPAKIFFRDRRENFLKEERVAKEKEEEMKKEHSSWTEKMRGLSDQEKNLLPKVEKEGNRYQEQKNEEITFLKERLKREEEFLVRLEKEKSKKYILNNLKANVVEKAKETLKNQENQENFHSQLYKNFSEQLEKQA